MITQRSIVNWELTISFESNIKSRSRLYASFASTVGLYHFYQTINRLPHTRETFQFDTTMKYTFTLQILDSAQWGHERYPISHQYVLIDGEIGDSLARDFSINSCIFCSNPSTACVRSGCGPGRDCGVIRR